MKEPVSSVGRLFAIAPAVLALGLAVVEWRGLFGSTVHPLGDLLIYREAIRYADSGGALYDFIHAFPDGQQLGFTYPPFAAVVLHPLAWLPDQAGNQLWTLTSFVLAAVLGILLVLHLPRNRSTMVGPDPHRVRILLYSGISIAVVLLSQPFVHTLVVGQVSVAITTLAFVDAARIIPRRWQGSLIGLAGAIKLTPLVFIPYLLFTRQWRQVAVASVAFAAATALGFLAYPRDSLIYWGGKLFDVSRVGDPAVSRNKSLLGLLSRWGLPETLRTRIWLALCLMLAVAAIWQARRHARRGEWLAAALVIGCLSVAVSPISWPHHQAWAVLAGLYLLLRRDWRWTVCGAVTLAAFMIWVPTFSLVEKGSLALRVLWEVPVMVFAAICAAGLPSGRPDPTSRAP